MRRCILLAVFTFITASVWAQEAYISRDGTSTSLWITGKGQIPVDVTKVQRMEWDKTGKRLAMIQVDGLLFLMNVEGGTREIAKGVKGFRWSPFGDAIAYESDGKIWIAQSSEPATRVTEGEAVAWSPDGARIVYSSKGSIWISLANGSSARRIANGRSAKSIDWSQDGRQLVFQDKGLANKPGGIFVVGANRVGFRKIAEGKAERVAFSPDGRRVLVEESAGTRIYDLEKKGAILLAKEGSDWRWIGSRHLESLAGGNPVQAEWPNGTLSPLPKPNTLPSGVPVLWAHRPQLIISNDLLNKGPFADAAKPVPDQLRIQGFVESVDPLSGRFTLSVGTTINHKGWETNLSQTLSQPLLVPDNARENDGKGRYKPLRVMNIRPDQEVSVIVRAPSLNPANELEVAEVWIGGDQIDTTSISGVGPRLQGLPLAGDGVSPEKPVVPLVYPVVGKNSVQDWWLASRGGGTRRHLGQDIMAPKMTPMVACFDGIVYLGRGGRKGHYTISIRGDNGWIANYYHLNNDTPGTDDGMGGDQYAFAPGLESGQRVFAGQFIGYVGDSGNAESTAPHLHFELWDQITGGVINAYPSLMAATRLGQPYAQMALPELKPRKGEQRMDGIVRLVDKSRQVVQIDITAILKNGKRFAQTGTKKFWVKLSSKTPMFVRGHEDLKVGFEEIREGLEMTIMLPAAQKGSSVSPRLAAFAVAG